MASDDRTLAQDGLPTRALARALGSALGLTAVLHFPATALAGNTYVVNTAEDAVVPGKLSLRQAVAAADTADGNIVQFDPSLSGSTITLTTGQIQIGRGISIVGPGADKLTISGGDSSRIFRPVCTYSPSRTVSITSLTLSNGKSISVGGTLYSQDCQLFLSDVVITASHALSGGCIAFGIGTIRNSVVSGCSADNAGGGILVVQTAGGSAKIYSSTISFNNAVNGGGGIFVDYANNGNIARETRVVRSTINNNHLAVPSGVPFGGGGIGVRHSILELHYSTIAQNDSYESGGGVSFADAYSADHSHISHATIALNASNKTYGNGLYTVGGELGVDESIISGNFNKYGLTDLSASIFTMYANLVQSKGSAAIMGTGSIIGVDPHLARLDNYGGPTKTMLPNPDSMAIDTISSCANVDQRFLLGCVNGKSDMGAVERQIPEVVIFRDGFESG